MHKIPLIIFTPRPCLIINKSAHIAVWLHTSAIFKYFRGRGVNLLNLDIEVIVDDETCKNLPVLR